MKKAAEKKTGKKTAKKAVRAKSGGDGKGTVAEIAMKKQYLKSRPACKVTFRLPMQATVDAKTVHLVGDFNNWDRESIPMKRQKDGDFSVAVELENGREYRYRYLINGNCWENDWNADRYAQNPFGGDDSVVIIGDTD
jgi:1,4-alpha-glucan branching enzyme